MDARLTAYDTGNALAGPTAADAAITFRPLVSGVVVNTNGGPPFAPLIGSAQLDDETIGVALFAQSGFDPMTYAVMLDLSHVYTPSVSRSACCGVLTVVSASGPTSLSLQCRSRTVR